MAAVFIKLLNMSIAASWLILAVIMFRVFLKNAPKWIRCILWGLVAVRLICPFSIESIFSLLPSAETIPRDIMYADNPTIHTGVMAVNSVVNPYLSESMAPQIGNSINPMQVVMNIGTVIWIAGMMRMLIYACISYRRIKKKADVSLPLKENIYLCDYIDMPFVLGIFRPRIYLPSALLEDDKADFVIAHEKAHIRRRDHWWKPLGFLLLTIYWFNPVIWIAYILLCRDIELACDEYVIGSLKEKEKKTYSDALLACSIKSSGFHRNMISACPLAFGEVGVKDRVKAVLYYKRPAFWLVILGLLACVIAAICFLTDPKDNSLNAPEPFGHSYRVEEVVYGDGRFSFGYTADNAPRYQFTSDYGMLVYSDYLEGSEDEKWVQQFAEFEEVKLSPLIFDDYYKAEIDVSIGMIGPDTIRVNTKKAWRIDIKDDENKVFYYLILTDQGDVYLTYGYDVGDCYAAGEEGSLIRWVFKLARTDIFSCNTVSEDCDAYVEAAYYPNGFDWDYDQLPQGYINEKGVLVFTADWDTDELVVSEDYYHRYNTENSGGSTFIERETYTLEKNESGQFELNVELRSVNGDMAVYFVRAPEGVYVMKIIFAEDTASLDIAVKQETPVVDQEDVLNQAIYDAILNQYKPEKPDGLYHCVDFVLLEQEEICGAAPVNSGRNNIELITVYGMALHESFGFSGATFHEVAYDYVPVKLKFQKESELEYVLKDAWFPEKPYESWDFYQEAIWDAFSTCSEELATDVIYAIQDDIYLTSLRQNCYGQAVSFGSVDTDTVIEGLLEEIVASPGTFVSGVKDYIVANEDAYKELIHYGKYTLWYCFSEFLEGGQTDLRGQIMASACKEIMLGFGEAMLTDTEAAHGQEWFGIFYEIARSMERQYTEEELKNDYPGSWFLVKMADLKGYGEREEVPLEEVDWVKILKDHLRND